VLRPDGNRVRSAYRALSRNYIGVAKLKASSLPVVALSAANPGRCDTAHSATAILEKAVHCFEVTRTQHEQRLYPFSVAHWSHLACGGYHPADAALELHGSRDD